MRRLTANQDPSTMRMIIVDQATISCPGRGGERRD